VSEYDSIFDAIEDRDFEAVMAYMVPGFAVNGHNTDGETPLHRAALKGDLKIASLLISHGADIDFPGRDGATPLHVAACRGHLAMARYLVKKGADVNRRDNAGNAPIHHAYVGMHKGVMKFLASRGSKITEIEKTLLDIAIENTPQLLFSATAGGDDAGQERLRNHMCAPPPEAGAIPGNSPFQQFPATGTPVSADKGPPHPLEPGKSYSSNEKPSGDTSSAQAREPKAQKAIKIDPLIITVGFNLLPLVDPSRGGKLLKRVSAIRTHIGLELGIVLPGVRFTDDLRLNPNGYEIYVREISVARGEVVPDHYLAFGSDSALEALEAIEGRIIKDPVSAMDSIWIRHEQRLDAEKLGCFLVEPIGVVSRHLTEVIFTHADELLEHQDVQNLIDILEKEHPSLVRGLIPKKFSVRQLHRVLQSLVKERVSIRDLTRILEVLSDNLHISHSTELLSEAVRKRFKSSLCRKYANREGEILAITLDREVEGLLLNKRGQRATPAARTMSIVANILRAIPLLSKILSRKALPMAASTLNPEMITHVKHNLDQALAMAKELGVAPIVVCHDALRFQLASCLRSISRNVVVLSRAEIAEGFHVLSFYQVTPGPFISGMANEDALSHYYLGRTDERPSIILDSISKIAIVILSLAPRVASKVFAEFSPDFRETLNSSISMLPRIAEWQRNDLVKEFLKVMKYDDPDYGDILELLDRHASENPVACARSMEKLAGHKGTGCPKDDDSPSSSSEAA
jgi:hypothetical protein